MSCVILCLQQRQHREGRGGSGCWQGVCVRVVGAVKVQPVCHKGGGAYASVSGLEYGSGKFGRFLAGSCPDQAAHDVANHVVQKGIGDKGEYKGVAMLLYVDGVYSADRRGSLAECCPEGTEVVFTDEVLRCLLHGLQAEWLKNPADLTVQYAGANGGLLQYVAV